MDALARAALLLAAAGLAGNLGQQAGLPLPWMIGPMLVSATVGLTRGSPPVHWFYRPIGQVTVATAVGLYFTRAALIELSAHWWQMLAAAGLTIAAGYIAALVLIRLARIDGTTAFFASMPGGPVEMANVAERFGAPGGPVALAQTLRIAGIVLIVAPLLLWSQGALSGRPVRTEGLVHWPSLLLLYALSVATALAFRRLRISNAFFLGPVALAAALTSSGVWLSAIPFPLLAAGQVLLGVSLGSRFDRARLKDAADFVGAAIVSTAVLLILCAAIAVLLWETAAASLPALVVSTAPGSVTEMAITAKALNEDVAMVTAYHLVRIFIVIPLAMPLYRLFRRMVGDRVPFKDAAGPR